MVKIIKVNEMSYFKLVPLDEMFPQIKDGKSVLVYGNFNAMGPACSGLLIYNLDKEDVATRSIVFLDKPLNCRGTVKIEVKLEKYHYGIALCKTLSHEPFNVDRNEIITKVKKALKDELKGKIDISDLILYNKEFVPNTTFDLEKIVDTLEIENVYIDHSGKKVLIICKSIPIGSRYKIVSRNLYLIPIYDLHKNKLDKVIITIQGHVEE